jgi:transcriptional regulator with XRE-family HTH domain
MNEITEISADNLKAVRTDRGMNQDDLAVILGITQTAVSKIENGTRTLSESEKKLLDWYFFGTVPAHITAAINLSHMLEFEEWEWRIIGLIARRQGLTEAEWIVRHIREYLDIRQENELHSLSKVAEDPVPYRISKTTRRE